MSWIFVEVVVEVLAEQAGSIAALLQPDSDRALLVPLGAELLEAPVRRRVAPHVMVVSVKAGEDGGPRGATQRVADEGVLERGTLFDHRGAQLGHLLNGGEVQVVHEEEDYVGSSSSIHLFLGGGSSRAAGGKKGCQTSQSSEEHSTCPKPIASPHGVRL